MASETEDLPSFETYSLTDESGSFSFDGYDARRSFSYGSKGVIAQQPQPSAASRRRNSYKKHRASAGRTEANQRQEQPDLLATELSNLETLLTIDDNLTPPNRTRANHDEEKGRGRGREGDDTSSNWSTPPPKQHNSKKPQDPSLHHIQGTGIEFEDLTYTVVTKQKKDGVWIKREAHLLHGITGAASKGEVTAVMGPSGAGKSTLLDALAGRIASGSLGGITTVGGRTVTPTLMKRMSAYVMQDDQLFPMLTVWETLWFAAEVRLHRGMSRDEKRDRVTQLIDQLGLTNAQNTYIGDEKTRGISGGEKRRVSIGVDIIHGPALLFMDEPTSGLDSTSAYSVIEKVHYIANAGSTVILTIHQPSSRILQLFNRLIVVARGQLIYQGGPNYLSTHLVGFGRQVPRGENPVEYLLDVIQEYDKSAYGVEPLVLYNHDGTKLNPNDPEYSMRSVRASDSGIQEPSLSEYGQSPLSDISAMMSENNGSLFLKSPLSGYQSKSYKTGDYIVEAMEVGCRPHDDTDDAYDHSINRTRKLASQYYNGLLESLADRFRDSFMSPRSSLGRMEQRTPSPMNMTQQSPMQRTPLYRTPARTPLRSSLMTQCQENYKVSSESPSEQVSTDYTVTEKDYVLDEDSIHMREEKFANIWWREVVVLMFRNLKNFRRTPELFLSRQTTVTVMGFMMATLFIRARHHLSDLSGVTSIMSFFIFTVCLFFFSSNDAVPAFIMERLIYIRETSHNAYRASSYVIANAIVSLPFLAIQSLSYVLITWWALGFQYTGTEAFFFFFLILFVSLLCTSSFVMFVSSIVPNYVLGYMVVIGFTALFFLTCGFFVHREQIPKYWIWLHYLSTLKYPYESMLLNEFGNPKYQLCYFRDPTGECSLTGKSLLESLNVTQLTKWESLTVLGGMAVFYRFLFYCVLRFGSKNQRS